MSTEQQLYLGIDGGGSKCKAVITNEDRQILGEGVSGGANPFHHVEHAKQSIIDATNLALQDAGLPLETISELIAGVGLAGVNLPKYYNIMNAWNTPFKAYYLATDLHIACLGAHAGHNGAIMITGTGSCGYVSVEDKSLIVGGHGFPQGDQCSGAWFGYKAVEQVLLADDSLIESTLLTNYVLSLLECKSATQLVEKLAGQGATFYARIAWVVFAAAKAGDEVAKQIIIEATDYFEKVFEKLMALNPARFSIIGGLSEHLLPWLNSDIKSQIKEVKNPPEIGAVVMAMAKYAKVPA